MAEKALSAEMAALFPKLPSQFQEQARQAHAHVQALMQSNQKDQALSLLRHMRDVMKTLIPKEIQGEDVKIKQSAGEIISSISDSPGLAIPPLPSNNSHEMVALQRSLEELQMKVQETSAVTLIAKRVRDMEMEQKYFQLESRLRDLRVSVSEKIDSISVLTDTASTLARKELRKRTVSKNPFCEHEVGKFCEFCVGRDFDASPFECKLSPFASVATPPMLQGPLREDLTNKQTVLHMQQSLQTYQATLKDLLHDSKRQLESLKI